jgi:MFS transporter, DHA2 family, multidrug resistance protein
LARPVGRTLHPVPRKERILSPNRTWAIVATSTATVISMLDQTIANTALPTIAHDVNATAAASVWVINGYQLALTIAIIPLAAAGDILGYRNIYRAGIATFVIASLACALSHSLVELTAARFVQGLAGAAMTVTSAPINRLVFPANMLGRATGYSAMAVALGAAAGPIVSGLILSVASWQWLFAINIPIGIAMFALASWAIPPMPGTHQRFDWISAGLSVATFGLAVFGFDALGHREAAPIAATELIATAIVAWLFIRRELTIRLPMFAVDLFGELRFTLAAFACYASFISQTIAFIALPFAFQTVMGHTPLEVGEMMLPWLLASAAIAPFAGVLADRFNSSRLAAAGLAVFTLGLLFTALMPADAAPLDVMWRMAICGIGYGLFQSPNNRSIQGSAPRERSGSAQAIQAVARLTGQTTGAVIVALVFGLGGAHGSGTSAASTVVLISIATACGAIAAAASVWRGVVTGSIRLHPAH